MAQSSAPLSSRPLAIPPPSSLRLGLPPNQSLGSHNGHLSLSTFSPVTSSGIFEFDRILKAGNVMKRRKRTKGWQPAYLVLRPNLLSLYKGPDETKLRHQINLSDVSAVALRSDRRRKGDHQGLFGLFSPARNFHLEAESLAEASQWVNLIRREARLDEEDESMVMSGPEDGKSSQAGLGRSTRPMSSSSTSAHHRDESSSPEPFHRTATSSYTRSKPITIRPTSPPNDMSGVEAASQSDFSDTPFGSALDASPIARRTQKDIVASSASRAAPVPYLGGQSRQVSRANDVGGADGRADEERVIRHGFLLILKVRGGVRQWKRCWAVLRHKHLALYKNDKEYAALLILPIVSLVDAVDIDPISKTKQYCMQLISEDRSFRFCARSEEDVSRWLGALKSLLVKRKEASIRQPR